MFVFAELTDLDLSYCHLIDDEWFDKYTPQLVNLKKLNLKSTGLTLSTLVAFLSHPPAGPRSATVQPLAHPFSKLSNLKVLNMSDNALGDAGTSALFEVLPGRTPFDRIPLRSLDLSRQVLSRPFRKKC